jgi:neutral ceramidase
VRRAIIIGLAMLAAAPAAQAQGGPTLRAGVGRADITPKLGYYLGGWTRQDRTAQGQHTRLFASAMVLQRGDTKIALVSIDLFMVPGGLLQHVAQALPGRGFTEQNLIINASHTHSGPGGFANSPALNFAAPSLETAVDPVTFLALAEQPPADRQLYTFLVDRIATAVRRADEDLGPAALGWGSSRLTGVTRNRSLEAHLANHGVIKARGEGRVEDDPEGAEHTIDPRVDVLRVDKLVRRRGRRRRTPIGGWSIFPNHGTVTKSSFEYYNQDHHGSALRLFEAGVRRAGRVPRRQLVLNVYGNGNEGDMSAGLDHTGPAGSDEVGRLEGQAMLRAWRGAGRAGLTRRPALELRWTRVCFCGQTTETGRVADNPEPGLPFFTGSEEERGPLYEVTGQHYEDTRDPADSEDQGHKVGVTGAGGSIPNVVPLIQVLVRDKLISTLPGEPTKEIGAQLRQRVLQAVAGSGVRDVVVSGLTNEFILYITTFAEFERQHYEGGNTQYGPSEGTFLIDEQAKLAAALVRGDPAPDPYPFDPTYGVVPDGAAYPDGAASGEIVEQPGAAYARLDRAELAWRGGPEGLDRPVDRAFVTAQRRVGRRWRAADSDLGLAMLWTVDSDGLHRVHWEIPLSAKAGRYRLVVTAKRYRLVSRPFRVNPRSLPIAAVPVGPGRVGVRLSYPEAVVDRDLTYRPAHASGGSLRFRVGGRRRTVKRRRGSVLVVRVPSGTRVTFPRGAARDRYGNRNGAALSAVAP